MDNWLWVGLGVLAWGTLLTSANGHVGGVVAGAPPRMYWCIEEHPTAVDHCWDIRPYRSYVGTWEQGRWVDVAERHYRLADKP